MSLAVTQLSDNVVFVPDHLMGGAVSARVDDTDYHSFRRVALNGTPGKVCLSKKPFDLSKSDIAAINSLCDRREKDKNRQVKIDIAGALSATFNGRAYHLYELGCGKSPIMEFIPANTTASYTGIECDEKNIAAMRKKGFVAMNWDQAMQAEPQTGKPMVAIAIYALHMMVSSKLAKRLAKFTNERGFFVGNYYIDPRESRNPEGRTRLAQITANAGLDFIRVDVPGCRSNEYWVIFKPESRDSAKRFAKNLEAVIFRNRNPIPAAKNRRKPA